MVVKIDKKMRGIINVVSDVILVILVVMLLLKYTATKDIGKYNFCVEWNGDIYREDLLWKCWDIETGQKLCGLTISPSDDSLYVYNHLNLSDYISYPCTKYAKTISVSLPETELGEPEDIVLKS